MLFLLPFALAAEPVGSVGDLPASTTTTTEQPPPLVSAAPPETSAPIAATETVGSEPEYLARALSRGPIVQGERAPSGVAWAVRTSSGRALGMDELTRLVADPLGTDRLRAKRRAATLESISLAGIGAGLEIVAIGLLANGGTNNVQDEDWLWRGASIAAAGAFPIALCTLPGRANRERERWPALFYTPAQIDPLIERHNERVRKQLGLEPLGVGPPAPDVVPPPAAAPSETPSTQDAPPAQTDEMPEAEGGAR